MKKVKNVDFLKEQIQILYEGEIEISEELKLLRLGPMTDELQSFLSGAYNENQIAIESLTKIVHHLGVKIKETSNRTVQNIIREINSVIENNKGNKKAIQTLISIYYHTLTRFQVDAYGSAIMNAATIPDFITTQFLHECLNNKKEIKSKIQLLEEKLVRRRIKGSISILQPAYV